MLTSNSLHREVKVGSNFKYLLVLLENLIINNMFIVEMNFSIVSG